MTADEVQPFYWYGRLLGSAAVAEALIRDGDAARAARVLACAIDRDTDAQNHEYPPRNSDEQRAIDERHPTP